MHCKLCGDESVSAKVYRIWSPDDGWEAGHLCPYCYDDAINRRPEPDDYAWEKRGEFFSDEEDALSTIYG
jgi:hypothetical protein